MKNKDDRNIIGIDFQGWPVFKMTLREILSDLGAQVINVGEHSYLALNSDDILLDSFPRVLEDDGMGYGIKERLVTCADSNIYTSDSGDSVFNLFAVPVRPDQIERFR